MSDLELLCQLLDKAVRELNVSHDHGLWIAIARGRRAVRGVLVPAPWWQRLLMPMPTPKQFLEVVPVALAELDEELRRCELRERHREVPPVSPCPQSDRCERCSSRQRLSAVVEDCTLGPSLGLRMACATLCEDCENVPLREIFGAAEIAVRIGRHQAH